MTRSSLQFKPVYLLVVALLLSAFNAAAQSKFAFSNGLAVRVNASYNRAAIYQDAFAHALYKGTLTTPAEGATLPGTEARWTKIAADTAGRFRMRGGEGTYLYFSYDAPADRAAILNISGNSAVFVNGALHMGDPYRFGWMNVVVQLKKGRNDFYIRGGMLQGGLTFPAKPVLLDVKDPTAPFVVVGQTAAKQKAAVVVINTTANTLNNLQMLTSLGGKQVKSSLQSVPAYSTRKVYFEFDGSTIQAKGFNDVALTLLQNGKELDKATLKIESVLPGAQYSQTFVSGIDGSLQYYSVAPQVGGQKDGASLFFSVHGAGVEAINQVRAYKPKDWGNVVSPTNRRPRGFNWEDWGRLDAMEVLTLAKQKFKPDAQHIYLTGHSMGGHGTWFLGATYPDKWAAIAPCAGYPTLKTYGSADGVVPDTSSTEFGKLLLRASNQSDVPKLAQNYKQVGVYILHGDADETVPVAFARQMKQQLAAFHPDMNYYEYPGGSHWYGDHSVDWQPIFDLFKWHTIPKGNDVNTIDFSTASPGISASNHWATIYQQEQAFGYSRIQLKRNKQAGTISGTADNVALLKLKLADFGQNKTLSIALDGGSSILYTTKTTNDSIYVKKDGGAWKLVAQPSLREKGPHRYGTFKDGINKNVLYVYGTGGTAEEKQWAINKARYDAESWYYRGNGAFDIISDKEYLSRKREPSNIILIGNANTNAAWAALLSDCPVQITNGAAKIGTKQWKGSDLGAYFVWPKAGTPDLSVSVIAGTGLQGMNAVNANQYFTGGSGYADVMLYKLDMLKDGAPQVQYAGFYTNDWKLNP